MLCGAINIFSGRFYRTLIAQKAAVRQPFACQR
jgi:hypothetical protein